MIRQFRCWLFAPEELAAHVTNAVDHTDEKFDKGAGEDSFLLLRAIIRAGRRYL